MLVLPSNKEFSTRADSSEISGVPTAHLCSSDERLQPQHPMTVIVFLNLQLVVDDLAYKLAGGRPSEVCALLKEAKSKLAANTSVVVTLITII